MLACRLPNRSVIHVSGNDAHGFLQGLITQDINTLDDVPLIYACLLTPQGKFLYDFFIRWDANGYSIDCEGGDCAQGLLKKLMIYKLRQDVTLDLDDESEVWQVFQP